MTRRSVRCLCGCHAEVRKRTDRLPLARSAGQSCDRSASGLTPQANVDTAPSPATAGNPLRSRRASLHFTLRASAPALVSLDNVARRQMHQVHFCVAGMTAQRGHRTLRTDATRPRRSFATSASLVGSCRNSLRADFAWEPRDSYALTNTGWASSATRIPAFCNDCINTVSSIRK